METDQCLRVTNATPILLNNPEFDAIRPPPTSMPNLLAWNENGGASKCALIGEEVIGFFAINPADGEIMAFVRKAFRGRGFATDVLASLIDQVAKKGIIRTFKARVRPDTAGAVLATKLGFQESGRDKLEVYFERDV